MENESQEKRITVFNPTDFPFGVLSSNSVQTFYMTGKEREWGFPKLIEGKWKSVSQFVYTNMFSDTSKRSQMRDSLAFGFSAMQAIQSELDTLLFEQYVKQGLFKKITQNKNLLYKLASIRSYNLIYDETPYIVSVLNQIRYPKDKLVYRSPNKEAIFVSLGEAASVLYGIEVALETGSVINDNETYTDLIKWSKYKPPEPGMLDWIDLDNLVFLARLRLRNKKIIQDIEIFKNVLLNTFLDHILETEYPYLDKLLYERAKTQQLEQETPESIQHFKNQLYEIFLVGGITNIHKQILQKTEIYQPRQFVLEPYPEKTEHTLLNETLDLNTVPELLPSHESMMRVDGKSYLTVIHYAYDMLIKNMLTIYPGLNLTEFDINNIKIEELPIMYAEMQKEWTERTIRINNEAAMEAKLEQNSSILHFLFQTDPYPILWEDTQDPILGVYDGSGQNTTGKHLMFLRETLNRTKIKNKSIYINKNLANNSILQLWLYNTSLHFRNTLLLFDFPKTKELEYLYSVHAKSVKQRLPNTTELQILERAGLTSSQITAAFPMILVLASKEFGDEYISEIQIAQYSLRRYTERQKQYLKYNNPENYEEAFEVSKQYLTQAAEYIKLAPGVNTDIFVKSMLAGKRVETKEDYTPNLENLTIWSAAFNYFVVEESEDSNLFPINISNPVETCQDVKNLVVPPVHKDRKTIKMRTGKKGIKEVENRALE
jgi:predicted NAD-dependent protein-ADP-ribosyltransferase YbiA (DUF1768 family)